MKHCFVASLCKNGVLGGGLLVDDTAVTFKTGKVTVPQAWRNLRLPRADIAGVAPGRLGTVTLTMRDGTAWTFLVFARKRFLSLLNGAHHG